MSGEKIITKKSVFKSILKIFWEGIKKGATIVRYAIDIIGAIVVGWLIGGIVGGPCYLIVNGRGEALERGRKENKS